MSELSFMGKLMQTMELSKVAHVGMELTYFDVIELLGEIEALKGYIAELQEDNAMMKRSNELYLKDNSSMADEAIAYKEHAEAAEAKITNLHKIITKQAEKIKRQAARITELEALYAGTKRSKKAATIKAKYKALKAWVEQTRWRIAL